MAAEVHVGSSPSTLRAGMIELLPSLSRWSLAQSCDRRLYVERPDGPIPLIEWLGAAAQLRGVRPLAECVRLSETGQLHTHRHNGPGDLFIQAARSWRESLRARPPRWVRVFHFDRGRASFLALGDGASQRRVLRTAYELAHLLDARVVDEQGDRTSKRFR
jgi:hypothetical protein